MNKKATIKYITFETPLGWLLAAESPQGIALINFLRTTPPSDDFAISTVLKEYPDAAPSRGADSGLLGKTKAYILEYFNKRAPLPKVPLDLSKGSAFDRTIWRQIEDIAFGESLSYGQIAAKAQNPGASRAVGGACGRNPVPILIPCHRVVGSGGKLGGFSAGLHIKRALLEIEGFRN